MTIPYNYLGNGSGSTIRTYMKVLLIQGDKAKEKWYRKGSKDEPHEYYIATNTREMTQPLYE
jgi:hypothetical protein